MKDKLNKIILELPIFNPNDSFQIVKDFFKDKNINEIMELAQATPCDVIGLKFNITNENEISQAKDLLNKLLPKVKKPLMIRGVNNDDIDRKLIPALIQTLDRESIIAFANENTYKDIVPLAASGNHKLVIRTPIDINLAKEMNILTSDLGLPLENIIIDTDTGGLGYGLEYGYSIMEKIKLETQDEYLNLPIISFAAEESLKTKETKSDNFPPSYGNLTNRAIMYELTAASAVKAAGASYLVLNYPPNVEIMKGLEA